ncbi:MAG: hypothetical protein ACYC0B_00215 [Gemmatimonadaceae bacterium]
MPNTLARRRAAAIACALALTSMFAAARAVSAQDAAPAPRAAETIALMRADLVAKRYATVIERGNDLLSSPRPLSRDEQMALWQVLAAAYYPPEVAAQRPDSAMLPLDALVRLAPDVRLPRTFSWPGLDSLLERSRSRVFAVVTRPVSEYAVSMTEPAYLTVVATRPARFRLTTISLASGVATVQDSTDARRDAMLRIRAHDGVRTLISPGRYELRVWARDVTTGDTTVLVHQFTASGGAPPALVMVPPFVPPTTTRTSASRRGAMVLGGLAFAGATIAIANGARAEGALRREYSADSRAMIVGAAMVGAAVTGLFTDRGRTRPADEETIRRARAEHDARVNAAEAAARARAARYRVTLRMEPEGDS